MKKGGGGGGGGRLFSPVLGAGYAVTTKDIFLIFIHHWRQYENHITVTGSRRTSFLHGMHCFQ